MSRFFSRFLLLVACMALAVTGVSRVADAQGVGYPGPFGEGGDFTQNDISGQTGVDSDGDGVADGSVKDGTSVDANPSGVGLAFAEIVQPVPSEDVGAAAGTGGGDSGSSLAHTGSDVEPIMAMSLGLLAVGGAALVASRRRLAGIS